MSDIPQRNIKPYGLRLQPELKTELEAAARSNKRSLNAEIEVRLEQSFKTNDLTQMKADIQEIKLLLGKKSHSQR